MVGMNYTALQNKKIAALKSKGFVFIKNQGNIAMMAKCPAPNRTLWASVYPDGDDTLGFEIGNPEGVEYTPN
jgi:hypothetical protein